MNDPAIRRTYERLWPDADRIRATARCFGGPQHTRRPADYLGLDLLNGGLREVWAMSESLGLAPSSVALELGCGIGGPARFIAHRYGCRVVGLDITPRQLAIARNLTRGLDVERRVNYVLGDARNVPFNDATFSHVYTNEALIHVSNKERSLAEAFRVLCPGGTLCIQDPVGEAIDISLLEGTLHPFSLEEYRRALTRSGFCDIVAIDRTRSSEECYRLLGELVATGPISPYRVLTIFDRIHGLRPSWWRLLVPERLVHTLRFFADRSTAARQLLGSPEHVEALQRMCVEIVASYRRGLLRFYLFRARRPQ